MLKNSKNAPNFSKSSRTSPIFPLLFPDQRRFDPQQGIRHVEFPFVRLEAGEPNLQLVGSTGHFEIPLLGELRSLSLDDAIQHDLGVRWVHREDQSPLVAHAVNLPPGVAAGKEGDRQQAEYGKKDPSHSAPPISPASRCR